MHISVDNCVIDLSLHISESTNCIQAFECKLYHAVTCRTNESDCAKVKVKRGS